MSLANAAGAAGSERYCCSCRVAAPEPTPCCQALPCPALWREPVHRSKRRARAVNIYSVTSSRDQTPAISRNGRLWNIDSGSASVRLDVEGPDDLAPLFGLVGDELAEVGGREREHVATQVGKPRFHIGVGQSHVDLLVELVDDLSRRVLGRTEAKHRARFVARHEIAHGRDVWQPLP